MEIVVTIMFTGQWLYQKQNPSFLLITCGVLEQVLFGLCSKFETHYKK